MLLVDFFSSPKYWGWFLIILLGIGLFFALFFGFRHFFLGTLRTVNGESTAPNESSHTRKKKLLGHFFSRYGYFPKDPLSRSFVKALSFLKNVIGGRWYRYRLPFFVVLGASGSGKTTLISSLKLPALKGGDLEGDLESPCHWHFFDQGVLLDVSGSLIMEKNSLKSEEEEWNLLLNLLLNYRPNRPLDGIVLTVSAQELLTKDEIELRTRAQALSLKLWQAQKTLGLKLPIFIIITHCDRVVGFSSFSKEIPTTRRDDIFGWSNSYPLETSYNPLWVDESFHQMTERIIRVQQEIFAHGKIHSEKDGLLLFPKEFENLKSPLKVYMDHLFKGSSLKEQSFLRGIFFSGDSHEKSLYAEKILQNLEFSFDGALGATSPSHFGSKEDFSFHPPSLNFISGLFREKIFLEKGLVRFTRNKILANNHFMRLAQISFFLLFTGGILGLMNSYNNLISARNILLPNINHIGYSIQRSLSEENRLSLDHHFFQQQAQLIMQFLTEIHSERLFSFFIPSSWMSPLDHSIRKVLTVAYDVVILRAVAYKIRERIEMAIIGNLPELDLISEESQKINPIQTPSFLLVQQYVEEMSYLQDLILKYNDLTQTASLKDFGHILEGLFGKKLLSSFYEDKNGIYKKALSDSHTQPISFYQYTKRGTERLNQLIKDFLAESLHPANLTPQLEKLHKALKKFSQAKKSYSLDELRELLKDLSGIINTFSSPESIWLKKKTFNLGSGFQKVSNKIGSCNFFEASIMDTFLKDCEVHFNKFRGLLAGYRSPLTGPLFLAEKENGSFISPSLLNLQGFLNLLLTQSFMSSLESRTIEKVVPSDMIILWNYKSLNDSLKIIKDFNSFFATKISAIPENTQMILREICLKGLISSLNSKIKEAQQIVPLLKNDGMTSPEETYLPEIQNLRSVMPALNSLMEEIRAVGVQEVKKDFQEVLKNQCLRILEKIDEIFEGDSPYEPQQEAITHWRGKEQIFQSFGVRDLSQLVAHLNLQRQRMNYLGREFVEPIVKILAVLHEKDFGRPTVLEKWDEILTQLNLYQQGSSNAIFSLEKFIAIDLPQMNVANCPMVLASVKEDGSNYFTIKQERLRSLLKAQCKSANVKASESAYIKLANLFNSTLAGRYPFVPRGFTKYPDATIEDIENFYKLFEAQGRYAIELLRLKVKKQSCARNPLNFLLKMEKLRPFFNLLLPKSSEKEQEKQATPSLPFEINFRTNQSGEKEANQIISWILKIGEETYEFSDTKIKGRWSYNDEIALEMRWALGSPYHPIQVKAQPSLETDPLTATFRYKGCWAFLRMLELQKPFVSDFPDGKDPSPSTLRFDIPTALKDPIYQGISSEKNIPEKSPPVAKVFMSLKPVSQELKNFNLPSFPVEAPPMSLLEATKVSGKVFKKPKKSLASNACGTSSSCKKPKKSKKKSISPRKKGKKI